MYNSVRFFLHIDRVIQPLLLSTFFFKYINLFIFSCVGSSLLRMGFLQLRGAGATLCCGVWASHCGGFSFCRAQALGARAQQLWCMGLVAPRHVGSSRARAQTLIPCIGRQILNHCATREVPYCLLLKDPLYHPKKKPHTHQQSLPIHPATSPALGNHQSTFCLYLCSFYCMMLFSGVFPLLIKQQIT